MPAEFLSRHLRGDWGDLCEDAKAENEPSLKHDFWVMSNRAVTETRKPWIITESDQSVITVLLPEEDQPAFFSHDFDYEISDRCDFRAGIRIPDRKRTWSLA